MDGMDRADLELVVTLARTGTLTAAAESLHVAQPALSRRLSRLERRFGAQLFVRGRHGSAPTAVGHVLVDGARNALDTLLLAEQRTLDAAAGRAGQLRVGTTPTLGADVLPEPLARFHRGAADVRVELVESGDSAWLHGEVRAGRLDLAIAAIPAPADHELTVVERQMQTFVLIAPAAHPLAKGDLVRRRDLAGVPMVLVRHGQGLRQIVDALFGELGLEPIVAIETTQREMLVPLVAAGMGVSVAPEVFARQRAVRGIARVPFDPPLERRVGVVVRAGPLPALVRRFTDVI